MLIFNMKNKGERSMINTLMVGVDKERVGGMWTVAETFIKDKSFNQRVKLYYVATSTGGTKTKRIKKMLEGYFKILVILISKKVDIVHIHMAERGSVYRKGFVIRLAKLFNKKIIVQMHAGPILAWYNGLTENRKKRVAKILNNADKVLVLGEYWKNQMTTIIDGSKIDILYNGAECPEKNLYNANGEIILHMGVLKKTKGTYDLVDAIKLIDDKLPNNEKIFLCGVDETGEVKKYVEKCNLKDRVVMTGWIDKNRRLEFFKNTKICVLPSYFEALSMTVIESMCYGIPMITTDISTMGELLGNEIERVKPGDIKKLADLILKLSGNLELRKRISEIEYHRAKEKFSVTIIMKKTIEIYNELFQMNN